MDSCLIRTENAVYLLGACVSPHQVQGLEGHLHLPVGHPQCGGDGPHIHQGGHPSPWTSEVIIVLRTIFATCIDTSTLFIFDNMESPLP